MKKELEKIRKFKYDINLALDDAKQLFVLLGKYITAVEMRI